MDGRAIVITSGKGGVGKTTVSANLGSVLAQSGSKVCLIDADIGLRNLDVVLGLENRIVYHVVDVISGRCRLKQALIRDKRNENLYLLPASQSDDKNAVEPEQVRQLCQDLKKEFDYLLIDCPAGIEQGFRNAVAGADQAIVVTTPEVSAIRDADRIIGLLHAQQIDTQLIINRLNPELVRRGDMLDQKDVIDILAIELLGIVPVVSAVMGTAAGGPSGRAMLSHWTIMVKGTSQIFAAGPPVVERAWGKKVSKEELVGAQMAVDTAGTIDNAAESEADCLE